MTFNYFVNVQVNNNPFGALGASASVFENHLAGINRGVQALNSAFSQAQSRGSSMFSGIGSNLTGMVAQLGGAAAAISSLNKTADDSSLKKSIIFSGGEQGVNNLGVVKQAINDLKLPMEGSLEGFKTLSGGLMGTGIVGKGVTDIFTGVAEGATVMGLKTEETKGVFLALGQMASKGTVSAEELRGQLGERLPGAFGIAARAMGVSQQALGKMMEQGQVVSSEFLPKFAAEMHKTFGGAVGDALNGARANFNVFQNKLYEVQTTFGESVMPAVLEFLSRGLNPMLDVFIAMPKWIGENRTGLEALTIAIGGVYLVSKTATFWLGAQNLALLVYRNTLLTGSVAQGVYMTMTSGMTLLTGGFTTAMTALNAAFWANPVMWVVGGLVALGAGLYYAYQKSATFRATIWAVGYTLKEFGMIIYDWVIKPIYAFGEILVGSLTGNMALMKQGMADTADVLAQSSNAFTKAGNRLGNAFTKGWNEANALEVNYVSDEQNALMKTNFANSATKTTAKPTDNMKAKADGINGGGRKVTTINIDLRNLVEHLTIQTTNITEGSQQAKEILIRELLQVINGANQIQL